MEYYVAFIALALLYCGYLLGKDQGVKQCMQVLFDTKLLTPEQVAKHYADIMKKD